jgi:hypothetical protein
MLATKIQYHPPFRVLSARGYMLGEFSERDKAMFALRTWAQAVAVIQDDHVIARKDGGTVLPGVKPLRPNKKAS